MAQEELHKVVKDNLYQLGSDNGSNKSGEDRK